uniref:Uncharacterized protein n=1 Tax=Ditylenchus dipsaci TaxID=166011 RepID=A0A915E909_9BILA
MDVDRNSDVTDDRNWDVRGTEAGVMSGSETLDWKGCVDRKGTAIGHHYFLFNVNGDHDPGEEFERLAVRLLSTTFDH